MEDVKESVKQGVSKVAGRLSGMASGVMTQLQVRYQIFRTSYLVTLRFLCYIYWSTILIKSINWNTFIPTLAII